MVSHQFPDGMTHNLSFPTLAGAGTGSGPQEVTTRHLLHFRDSTEALQDIWGGGGGTPRLVAPQPLHPGGLICWPGSGHPDFIPVCSGAAADTGWPDSLNHRELHMSRSAPRRTPMQPSGLSQEACSPGTCSWGACQIPPPPKSVSATSKTHPY